MTGREEIIAKLEKEVKRTYAIKTAIYEGGEKVEERIIEHREPFVTITIEIANKIFALLKEQETTQKGGYNLQELWKRARAGETLNETELNFLLADWDERNIFKQQEDGNEID